MSSSQAGKSHFSFKKQPRETGLRSVANPYPTTDIRLEPGKRFIGHIVPPNFWDKHSDWHVTVCVKDEKSHCGWTWKIFKARHSSEPHARAWIKNNEAELLKIDFHFIDDYGK